MPGGDYANRFVGQVGIVRKNYKDKIGVQIDGYSNPDSEYGVFWFEERFLAVIPDAGVIVDDAIKKIIFSGPKTIILWKDGTKTIVTCGDTLAKCCPTSIAIVCTIATSRSYCSGMTSLSRLASPILSLRPRRLRARRQRKLPRRNKLRCLKFLT